DGGPSPGMGRASQWDFILEPHRTETVVLTPRDHPTLAPGKDPTRAIAAAPIEVGAGKASGHIAAIGSEDGSVRILVLDWASGEEEGRVKVRELGAAPRQLLNPVTTLVLTRIGDADHF